MLTLWSRISSLSAVSLLALGILVACDAAPTFRQVGVSGLPTGDEITIHFRPCNDLELVRNITLYEGRSTPIGDGDDPILWQIVSGNGSPAQAFEVGKRPSGFTEPVALTAKISATTRLSVRVEFDSFRGLVGFRPEELRPDSVVSVGDENLSMDEFSERARDACN